MKPGIRSSLALILLFMLVWVLTATGCLSYTTGRGSDGYRELHMVCGPSRFSFEYPSNWRVAYVYIDRASSMLVIQGPELKRADPFEYSVQSATWGFFVDPINGDFPSAEAVLEHHLSNFSYLPDFKLLGRSDLEIGGLMAKQVVFTCSVPQNPLDKGPLKPPQPTVGRIISFTHNGLIYLIEVELNSQVVETNTTHVEHMIQSFKILQ